MNKNQSNFYSMILKKNQILINHKVIYTIYFTIIVVVIRPVTRQPRIFERWVTPRRLLV